MIWHMPLEQYEERYTEQWYRWFNKAFKDVGIEYQNVEGVQLTREIQYGSVLDIYGTHYYKFTQLKMLVDNIRNGHVKDTDRVFFADLWYPGIEALEYIRNVSGKKFKIVGVLHAGTWDMSDFTYKAGMRPWAQHIELGWLKIFDEVYVGSEFHKSLILDSNDIDPDKILVTGLPFESDEVNRSKNLEKENIVVFPHRLDSEKRPDLFERLKPVSGWQFLKTKDVTESKEEYYELLGRSRIAVSFAEQETFGYAMLEALANGCYLIVPNRLSYATMDIYNDFRVPNLEAANEKILWYIDNQNEAQSQVKEAQKKLEQYKTETFVRKIC